MSQRSVLFFSRLGAMRSALRPLCNGQSKIHLVKNRLHTCRRYPWITSHINTSSACISQLHARPFSQQKSSEQNVQQKPDESAPPTTGTEVQSEESMGIFQRFKAAYKEHGKVLIGVHLVTSSFWLGSFYYAAASGFDITPLLAKLGASDRVIEYLSSTVGNLATAYVMYKIATPARYTVTVLGTYSTVKYMRKLGYMEAPPEGDSIRELMKDGQIHMKEKYGDLKDDIKEKYSEIKVDVKDKMKKRKED